MVTVLIVCKEHSYWCSVECCCLYICFAILAKCDSLRPRYKHLLRGLLLSWHSIVYNHRNCEFFLSRLYSACQLRDAKKSWMIGWLMAHSVNAAWKLIALTHSRLSSCIHMHNSSKEFLLYSAVWMLANKIHKHLTLSLCTDICILCSSCYILCLEWVAAERVQQNLRVNCSEVLLNISVMLYKMKTVCWYEF